MNVFGNELTGSNESEVVHFKYLATGCCVMLIAPQKEVHHRLQFGKSALLLILITYGESSLIGADVIRVSI